MRICAVQTRPFAGDIARNIEVHLDMIKAALAFNVDLIVFPELSITGYEPKLAKRLAIRPEDERLNLFQKISDQSSTTICVGAPLRQDLGVQIGMVIFQPDKSRFIYAKQHLHSDEVPFFIPGRHQVHFQVNDLCVAPAICYESMLPVHVQRARDGGASIYLASVAKSAEGMTSAFSYFPNMATEYDMTVLLANCIGKNDDLIGAGQSAVWDRKGELSGHLNEIDEGILVYDTHTDKVIMDLKRHEY